MSGIPHNSRLCILKSDTHTPKIRSESINWEPHKYSFIFIQVLNIVPAQMVIHKYIFGIYSKNII